MAKSEPFQVDLSNPDEIASALERAEKEVIARRVELKDSVEQLQRWELLYERLATLSGRSLDRAAVASGSIRDRIERIVNEAETPVDTAFVSQLLPGAQRKTIAWNLWDLEKKKKIQRIAEGLYARLDFKPENNGS